MKKASILIVDDNEGILETLSAILEEKGYRADTAKNGKEAIEKSKTNFYNLALLDIKLPDIEGTKLLTEMKETKPKMVKIMITGYASLQNAVEALNFGADAYIMKPVDPENLLRVINEKLKAQREAEKMNEEKITEWIETRARKLEKERR
ncbi:MAG: response regulator [Candidatus Bathyarchaeia archaeon]